MTQLIPMSSVQFIHSARGPVELPYWSEDYGVGKREHKAAKSFKSTT